MAALKELVAFCDDRTRRHEIADFPGACNGLQCANAGQVTKIGAAVDAGLQPFRMAVEQGVDFLIVHHGMFWDPFPPVTGLQYQKLRTLMEGNLAVYGSHLPLDLHPEIGNNALLAAELDLRPCGTFLEYEGNHVGLIAEGGLTRRELAGRMGHRFAGTFTGIEYGPETPTKIGILTGSGSSAVPHLRAAGIDTLITGELKQNCFNQAQEKRLNLYCCGHYATEVFGVQALAAMAAEKFELEWTFLQTDCPL